MAAWLAVLEDHPDLDDRPLTSLSIRIDWGEAIRPGRPGTGGAAGVLGRGLPPPAIALQRTRLAAQPQRF